MPGEGQDTIRLWGKTVAIGNARKGKSIRQNAIGPAFNFKRPEHIPVVVKHSIQKFSYHHSIPTRVVVMSIY